MRHIISLLFVICSLLSLIDAHGRLWEPAARSTAWRVDSSYPAYYNDNEMFCGGANHQWQTNGGKCSVCGESFTAYPKQFEKGGKYYTGRSIKTYRQGQTIDAHVELTANHLGWFEFRICNIDGMSSDATQECLDRTLLKDSNGQSRFSVSAGINNFYYKLVLPSGLTCKQCVFQWKYHTGNSWGASASGAGCLGCGDAQEEFYGCSDVTITVDGSNSGQQTVATNAPQTAATQTAASTTTTTTKQPTVVTTGSSSSSNTKCKQDGYFADLASNCQKYYICQFTGTTYESITYQSCPTGLLFDNKAKNCNYANLVNCA